MSTGDMKTKGLPDYLASVLDRLASEYEVMTKVFDGPNWVVINDVVFSRYREQSDSLICFLKGVKLISTLNAAIVLLRAGYAQEIGVLCRVAGDCCNDIVFILKPQEGDEWNKNQAQFVKDFFQEEFVDPKDILGSWPVPGFEDTEFGVFMEPGGVSWRDGSLRESSSLRRSS
jgi:hypothetical protein